MSKTIVWEQGRVRFVKFNNRIWWTAIGDDAYPYEVQLNENTKRVLVGEGYDWASDVKIMTIEQFIQDEELLTKLRDRFSDEYVAQMISEGRRIING